MGRSKANLFSEEQNQLSEFARALAHPARIAILQHLLTTNACVCGDIVDQVGLAQSTVSQHLKVLKETGLIQGDISGVQVCYCIHASNWKKIQHLLGQFITNVNIQCC